MGAQDDYETAVESYDIVYFKKLPNGVTLEKNVVAAMRDGVKIAMDVYKPEDGKGPWPVLLCMAPYKKEMLWETGNVGFYVSNGYAMVNAQVRGSGLSQGQYNFFDPVEQRDGYDLVEWIAEQPWCDGNVGMFGASYLAMSQWYTAIQNPPHLKCITPYSGGTDLYRNSHYVGGVYHKFFMNMWGPGQTKQCLWPGPVPGKLPPVNLLADWYTQVEDGPYYWERSPYRYIDQIKIPVLSVLNAHNFIHSMTQLRSWPDIKAPKKLIVVPETPGIYQTFLDTNLGINQQLLRWLDHWLKSMDTGIMDEPPVAIYDNGRCAWRYENEYPIARTKWTKFYLGRNVDNSSKPQGLVQIEPPQAPQAPDIIEVPSTPLMERFPVKPIPFLTYASQHLTEDLTVQGPISVTLFGSVKAESTCSWAWYVKIGEAAPDGKVRLWTYGNLKASYRKIDEAKSKPGQPWHSYQNPKNAESGKIYEFNIEITPLFLTFKAGHRIWVQISCEDPNYENANAFDPIGIRDSVSAKVSLYIDPEHPSHLLLPVIPDTPEIASVTTPLSDAHWNGPKIEE